MVNLPPQDPRQQRRHFRANFAACPEYGLSADGMKDTNRFITGNLPGSGQLSKPENHAAINQSVARLSQDIAGGPATHEARIQAGAAHAARLSEMDTKQVPLFKHNSAMTRQKHLADAGRASGYIHSNQNKVHPSRWEKAEQLAKKGDPSLLRDYTRAMWGTPPPHLDPQHKPKDPSFRGPSMGFMEASGQPVHHARRPEAGQEHREPGPRPNPAQPAGPHQAAGRVPDGNSPASRLMRASENGMGSDGASLRGGEPPNSFAKGYEAAQNQQTGLHQAGSRQNRETRDNANLDSAKAQGIDHHGQAAQQRQRNRQPGMSR